MIPTPTPAGRAADGGHESPAQRRTRFEREAMAHRSSLLATARGLTRNPADAEDLVQETLARAYVSFDHFRPGTSFGAWTRRILRNHYIDAYRRGKGRPQQCPMEDVGEQLALQGEHGHPSLRSPEAAVIDRLTVQELMTALREVPPPQRAAVYLADVEGLSYREVADRMATPIGTVMSRIHRGRKRLRSLLAAYAPEGSALLAAERRPRGEPPVADAPRRALASRAA
ncbi:sigma-70 family RNA polymerase sigma factor [Streptomyces sp. NPDC101225]|uniref:sigma-70 family RNA polymerase sigma factor n=1 Tax=Streptomyces sp. NPDC101225 TaxID=3366135 RepID=UPI0038254348